MWSDLQFNTLVFFTNQPSLNTRRTGSSMQFSYVQQALALSRSLETIGKGLRVFTNNRDALLEMAASISHSQVHFAEVKELSFPSDIPATIPFFAAHHKFFLFSVFAQENRWNCLLDSDVVANREKNSLIEVLEKNPQVDGWVYDISDQVFPAYGTSRVQDDLRCALGVQHPFPRWYGTEFIAGNSGLFGYLHQECSRLLDRHIESSTRVLEDTATRVSAQFSDETLISAALNNNFKRLVLADAGASGLVVRHWTSKTLHVKMPPSVLKQCLFWHLPNSKDAVARYYKHGDLRILYRDIQGLTAAKSAVGLVRHALGRV